MFDARGYEFVFDWSRLNGRWHDLHPLLGEMINVPRKILFFCMPCTFPLDVFLHQYMVISVSLFCLCIGNAHTAALPYAFMAHHTVLKFLCFNIYRPDLRTICHLFVICECFVSRCFMDV